MKVKKEQTDERSVDKIIMRKIKVKYFPFSRRLFYLRTQIFKKKATSFENVEKNFKRLKLKSKLQR